MENTTPKKRKQSRLKVDIGSPAFYADFRKHYPDILTTRTMYGKISRMYNAIVREYLYGGGSWEMPRNLGKVEVIKYKPNVASRRLPIDRRKSNRYKKIIYQMNEHSGGYRFTHDWVKPKAPFNVRFYRYVPVAAGKRQLRKLIMDKKAPFVEKIVTRRPQKRERIFTS